MPGAFTAEFSQYKQMNIKQQLYSACLSYVESRIAAATEAIDRARESARGETKSSAGDKYETGRAMAQLEIENNTTQVAEAQKLLQSLKLIDTERQATAVGLGSIVKTKEASYFLAISIGKLGVEGHTYLVISPAAPVAQAMLGKKVGDEFVFAGKKVRIEEIV